MFKRLIKPISSLLIPSIGYLTYNYMKPQLYTEDEVAEHNDENDAWVTHKNKVYDITDFVNIHPGGKDNILMAAGGPIDVYWNLYKQHNTDYVSKLLEKYLIGELADYKPDALEDEYANEPKRDLSNLLVHKQEPLNAESNTLKLLGNYITPEKNWFTRNHHPVPDVNIKDYNLVIGKKSFNYDDILNNKISEIVTTIQCAGNRREELNKIEKTMGLPWSGGAISTGKWTGVWLHDIIDIPKNKKYINLYDYNSNFSVSVPIDTPLFIAYKMNGSLLSRDRGFPLRVIAPGLTGSKNVKWIHNITFSDKEVESSWQTGIAYKVMPNYIKNVEDITPDLKSTIPTIDILPIQSYICNKIISNNHINLSGYALAGGNKKMGKVEISRDGVNWTQAKIYMGENEIHSWCFWKTNLEYHTDDKYMCRATDEFGNTQDKVAKELWNIRGIANNSIHVN